MAAIGVATISTGTWICCVDRNTLYKLCRQRCSCRSPHITHIHTGRNKNRNLSVKTMKIWHVGKWNCAWYSLNKPDSSAWATNARARPPMTATKRKLSPLFRTKLVFTSCTYTRVMSDVRPRTISLWKNRMNRNKCAFEHASIEFECGAIIIIFKLEITSTSSSSSSLSSNFECGFYFELVIRYTMKFSCISQFTIAMHYSDLVFRSDCHTHAHRTCTQCGNAALRRFRCIIFDIHGILCDELGFDGLVCNRL